MMKNLIVLLLLFACNVLSSKNSEHLFQLETYENAIGSDRVVAANQLMQYLYDSGFNDKTTVYGPGTPVDSLDKSIYFAATEYFFYDIADFVKAIKYAEKTVELCKVAGDRVLEGECESILAIAHFRRGEFAKALQHAERDLAIQRATGNLSNVSSALNTLAGIYLASKQYEEALKYISEALPLSTEAGDSSRMAIQMGMTAEILQAMHRSEEALSFAQRAYELDSLRGHAGKAAIRLSQMASAYMDLQQNEAAKAKLAMAIPLLQQVGNLQSLAICHNQMGELMNREGNFAEAVRHYDEALRFFAKVGDLYNEAKAQKGLHVAYRSSDPSAALQHLERFSELKDTLYSQEMKHNISMAHAKYHNEELSLQNEQEREVKSLTLLMSEAVVAALVILLGFVLYALRQRKRRLRLLRSLQHDKEQFFTNITHEFRTPLTLILGLAGRLKSDQLNADESTQEVAAVIERQGKTLLGLVNQLLDIARTDKVSIQADYRHGDVVGYIHMVVETCDELARQKHIDLRYLPSENRVEMDFVPDYICKILTNLLTNAIKFTPQYGNVRVSTHVVTSKGNVVILVEDDGCGIPPERLPFIFETFNGTSGTNGEPSVGVGLVLVKKLVEALGGVIQVDSKPSVGSAFRVELPLNVEVGSRPAPHLDQEEVTKQVAAPQAVAPAETEVANESKGALSMHSTILVVEDNADIANYIEHVLKKGHYEICHASDGEDGLQKAKAIVPDLIITDVMMPRMDGFELCTRLKSSSVTNHIPVMVITARTTEADKLHGIDCGAECYLYKPFSAEELYKRVRNIFEQRGILLDKVKKQLTNDLPVELGTTDESPLLNRMDDDFITKVNDFIHANMEQGGIDVDTLASHLCMSSKQFNRKLVHIVGYSAANYMTKLRIARACRLLRTSDEMVSVIAQKCGFDNPSNFTRTFKDVVGCSPSVWRKKNME